MWGFWWAVSAAAVAGGTPEGDTNRTGSPLSAAHPAAGMAYAGSLVEAITTSGLGLPPPAAVANRSIAAASVYGSVPGIAAARSPLTAATFPIRMIWAPAIWPAPVGLSRLSAFALAGGSAPEPESRIGART